MHFSWGLRKIHSPGLSRRLTLFVRLCRVVQLLNRLKIWAPGWHKKVNTYASINTLRPDSESWLGQTIKAIKEGRVCLALLGRSKSVGAALQLHRGRKYKTIS